MRIIKVLLLILVLSSCGGGSNPQSDTSPPTGNTPPPSANLKLSLSSFEAFESKTENLTGYLLFEVDGEYTSNQIPSFYLNAKSLSASIEEDIDLTLTNYSFSYPGKTLKIEFIVISDILLEGVEQFEIVLSDISNAEADKTSYVIDISEEEFEYKLRDTGHEYCYDNQSQINCDSANEEGFPNQDAQTGKDVVSYIQQSFSKINSEGQLLSDDANEWSCVKDDLTGLIWEIKSLDPNDPRYVNSDINFYDSNSETNGDPNNELSFYCNNGNEFPSCNTTEKYVDYVNNLQLCGYSDWRMPSALELFNLIDFSDKHSTPNLVRANVDYFNDLIYDSSPNYYSRDVDASFTTQPDGIRTYLIKSVDFNDGRTYRLSRTQSWRVRLVRGDI